MPVSRDHRSKNELVAPLAGVPESEPVPAALGAARPALPRLLTLHDLADHYRIPRSTAYELMNHGTLQAVKLGGRTLILTESVERMLATLPRFGG